MEITQSFLKEILDYQADGFFIWKTNRGKFICKGKKAGHYHKSSGRFYIHLNGKFMATSRVVFLWHHGWMPEKVDHIDVNCTNDKIENLRSATHSQNLANQLIHKNSLSGFKGVTWSNAANKWRARIKKLHLGVFDEKIQAAIAYDKKAVELFGEYARLNFEKDKK